MVTFTIDIKISKVPLIKKKQKTVTLTVSVNRPRDTTCYWRPCSGESIFVLEKCLKNLGFFYFGGYVGTTAVSKMIVISIMKN